jgi:hypothetical protein
VVTDRKYELEICDNKGYLDTKKEAEMMGTQGAQVVNSLRFTVR